MFLPYHIGGMGAGDVKLMAAVGALVGYPAIIQVFLYTAIAGGVIALLVLLRHRMAKQAVRNLLSMVLSFFLLRFAGLKGQTGEALMSRSVGSIPYGVAIALGTTAYLCFGRIV
jgi:prepilin peptidase CpaA